MELLLQAIEKKVANVDSERKRWLEYKTEHEQAGDNLREFPKSFRKQILVPIGSKALIPGHLYHTNEILVSMYNGLFAKCSADTALSVCEHRINEANKRIDELNVEHKMYRDRLELPADENAFGDINIGGGAEEIIEEYNEENEKKWREQHKVRMREYKQAEAEERKRQLTTSDIDIDAILEQAELMEELENELEQLNVNCDEQLQQHLQQANSGNGKERHTNNNNEHDLNDDEIGSDEFRSLSAAASGLSTEDKIKFYEIHLQKIQDYFTKNTSTIQNTNEFMEKRTTRECLENAIEELQEETSDDANSESEPCTSNTVIGEKDDRPHEYSVQNPNEPRKFHSPSDFAEIEREYAAQNKSKSELLVFYKGQLSHIVKIIAGCTASNVHTREQKRVLYEFLSDRISGLREEIQKEKQIKLEEDFVDDDDIDDRNVKQSCRKFNVNSAQFGFDDFRDDENGNGDGKRKINFAAQPSVVTFFEDDEPFIVSQQNEKNLADATFEFFNSPSNSSASSVCDDDDNDTDEDGDDNKTRKNCCNDSDNDSAEEPVPHLDLRNNLLKRETHYKNDCDINFLMNQSNERTINNQLVDDSCSKIMHSNAAATTTATAVTEQAPNQNKPKTLILQFSHSTNTCTATVSNDDDVINSPLDIYRKFGSPIETANNRTLLSPSHHTNNRTCQLNMLSATTTQSLSKAKSANETNVTALEVPNINQKPSKSILKKKEMIDYGSFVEHEAPIINDDIEDSLDERNQSDGFPKFTQVLGEIVEHSDANESNITSQSNDMQVDDICNTKTQPKKRISMFKKSRMS